MRHRNQFNDHDQNSCGEENHQKIAAHYISKSHKKDMRKQVFGMICADFTVIAPNSTDFCGFC